MTPFLKIDAAVKVTGLSAFYLRNGCKNGTIPHITSGKTYYINLPALLKQLGVPEGSVNNEERAD